MALYLAVLFNLLLALYHLLFPRHVRTLRALRSREPPDPEHAPTVAILVPMRDEIANVRRSLSALLRQRYPAARYEIIVIDDGSTDGTSELLAQIQTRRDRWAQPRLRVLRMPPLEPGWTGKSQALWWGSQAVADTVRWLLMIDADTFLIPDALATVVREAEGRELAMLSLLPREELATWWERVIVPVSLIELVKSVDLRAINDDARPSAAWASGQLCLIRHDAYERVGTHRAVRAEPLESVALAQRLRAMGYRVRMANGFRLAHSRMFQGAGELWERYQREGEALFQGSLGRVALRSLVSALSDLFPFLWPWLALRRGRRDRGFVLLLLSTLAPPFAVVVQRMRSAHTFQISRWYALTHPLGVAATLVITWSLWLRRLFRRPIHWKGREYRGALRVRDVARDVLLRLERSSRDPGRRDGTTP